MRWTEKDEKQAKGHMKKLGLSYDEAKQLVIDDKRMNDGEDLYPLTSEQEAVSKSARSVTDAPKVYTFGKKSKKVDDEKKKIIDAIIENIKNLGGVVTEIINDEREFKFTFNDTGYKIVLSKPRVPKK